LQESRKSRRGGGVYGESDESSKSWQERCKDLLNKLWNCRDAAPFKEPVDIVDYPDYYQQIDTPMDLQSIKEDLLGGNHMSPLDFSKDVQLIFSNSKQYNTDKHSAVSYDISYKANNTFNTKLWNKYKTFNNELYAYFLNRFI
jgi:bromodomain and WD repeat domain-containing protein 1/3